jgi:hypothetical protein
VAAEVAILMAKTSTKILGLLKQLFASIKQIGLFTKQMQGLMEQVGQTNTSQNTGSAGSTITQEDPEPGPINLPL